jgi:hypothetical protein
MSKTKMRDLRDCARRGNPNDLVVLRTARDKAQQDLDYILEKAKTENRTSLLASEARQFETRSARVQELDALIEKASKRADSATAFHAKFGTTSAHTAPRGGINGLYGKGDTDERGRAISLSRDLAAEAARMYGFSFDIDHGHVDRLSTYRSIQSGYEAEVAEGEKRAYAKALDALGEEQERRDAGLETRTPPNTSAGTGGEFVPPAWLVSSYIPLVRPVRVTADRCTMKALPPGIDVINIPKITTGALTAIQPAQGTAVATQDIKTSAVSGGVYTISGQEDISIQLLEQSPLSMDGVIFDDLSRDYAQRLDIQVLAGTGINGQHTGMLNLSGINSVTFTSGSPTVPLWYPTISQAVSQVINGRYLPPEAVIVHSRRWWWAMGQLDSNSNRPLLIPAEQGAFQASGRVDQSTDLNAAVGRVQALPVWVDPNVPTTMNGTATTGGTQDVTVVGKFSDSWLFESTMRLRALPEILSGTLQVRFQVYGYSSLCHRYPPSISAITGTGMAAPSGY